jgi:hypothetical protein
MRIVKTNLPQQPDRRIGMPSRRTAKDKLPGCVNLAVTQVSDWRTGALFCATMSVYTNESQNLSYSSVLISGAALGHCPLLPCFSSSANSHWTRSAIQTSRTPLLVQSQSALQVSDSRTCEVCRIRNEGVRILLFQPIQFKKRRIFSSPS